MLGSSKDMSWLVKITGLKETRRTVQVRITLSSTCECVRRGVGVSVVGPKECQGQSHQKYEVLYIPNLPAQLRRCGRGQMLEARGWYRHSRVTRGGGQEKKEPSSQIRRGDWQREREREGDRDSLLGRGTERDRNGGERRGRGGEGVRVREMGRGETARCRARGHPSH